MRFTLELGDRQHEVLLARGDDGTLTVQVDGETYEAVLTGSPGDLEVTVGETTFRIQQDGRTVTVDGEVLDVRVDGLVPSATPGGAGEAGTATIRPPMPGKIVEVRVAEGDEVEAGAVLLILEAMKMQNEVAAPRSGTVTSVHVDPGDTVEAKDVLIELE